MALFGSYADGSATEKSDVDLLVTFRSSGVSLFTLAKALMVMERHLDKSINWFKTLFRKARSWTFVRWCLYMKDNDRALDESVGEIEYMEFFRADVSQDDFLGDETLERACAMTSINIGELAEAFSESLNEEYPENELRLAARTRDVYAHGYFTLIRDGI